MRNNSHSIGPIRFSYEKSSQCLDVPTLELPSAGITVITGDNGSGKTTLLKILGGLIDPAGGAGNVDGLELFRRNSVYLHQNPYLFRGTVLRNLTLSTGPGVSEDPETTLKIVGLQGFSHRTVKTLSGGEVRRVALARVFHSSRKILLLDEPAAHVDAASTALIESACRKIAESGRTVVIASHKDGFGYRMADFMINLAGGRPTAGTLNILKGRVDHHDEGQLFFRSGETVFGAPLRDGEFSVAVISAADILLSRKPLESSARNSLKGTLATLDDVGDGSIIAGIDCGIPLKSLITSAAEAELKLVPGDKVFATFKASSVALY